MPVRWAKWGRTSSQRRSLTAWRLTFPGHGLPRRPQPLHLGLAQPPRLPLGELSQGQWSEADPLQGHDPIADRLDHPAHLPVATFAEDDLDLPLADRAHLCGRGRAVLEL